jgi:mercuric ion transport protein
MNTVGRSPRSSAVLSYFSLFTSVGSLLCCALPSLLVLAGLGASVASTLSAVPWLVALSRHKQWIFSISGTLIALSFINMYYLAPRLRPNACDLEVGSACDTASNLTKRLLWISAAIYAVGIFAAYALGPLLTRLDRN